MGTQDSPMVDKDPIKGLGKISTKKWNSYVDQFYDKYCTGEARAKAAALKDPKLHNTLIRLQEFSTVIEANQAMKAGDIGRRINVWKRWSIMAQGLPGLHNYATYLPRMVLLLTELLPDDLAKYFCHSILMSPSGREDHFQSKDCYLEVQNYWLKSFFNQTGNGTQTNQLKDLFSLNIHLLRDMMHSFRADTGSAVFTQSHHNIMSPKSLNVFLQMAHNFNILNESPGSLAPKEKVKKVQNSYVFGISKFKQQIDKDTDLNQYKQHMNPMAMETDTDVGEEHNQQEQGTQTREKQSRYEL
ncbi:hypothetical protein PCANC_27722 [Puccinia coronata f. sp. avenae]|uniref:DUF6589 domain-containing protein n=1 Tax=Puccinia coronata f. sp. avenae TaxID=200324 RepID=A0A2N5RYY9_9BASI|nr:hypothetical protein PCANC_27722 [Puccinia coronata f. sp. avenae]